MSARQPHLGTLRAVIGQRLRRDTGLVHIEVAQSRKSLQHLYCACRHRRFPKHQVAQRRQLRQRFEYRIRDLRAPEIQHLERMQSADEPRTRR